MAEGSPPDYEAARLAETTEIPLDYPGRGKLDVHATARTVLEFSDILSAHPGLEERMATLASRLEMMRRAKAVVFGAASKAGTLLVDGWSRSGGFEAPSPEPAAEPVEA